VYVWHIIILLLLLLLLIIIIIIVQQLVKLLSRSACGAPASFPFVAVMPSGT
jgi:hypothetical protein